MYVPQTFTCPGLCFRIAKGAFLIRTFEDGFLQGKGKLSQCSPCFLGILVSQGYIALDVITDTICVRVNASKSGLAFFAWVRRKTTSSWRIWWIRRWFHLAIRVNIKIVRVAASIS